MSQEHFFSTNTLSHTHYMVLWLKMGKNVLRDEGGKGIYRGEDAEDKDDFIFAVLTPVKHSI